LGLRVRKKAFWFVDEGMDLENYAFE